MRSLLKSLAAKWKNHRESKTRRVLETLKIRYHTFRILLANNDRSLDLLRSLDRLLNSSVLPRQVLADEVEELLNVTYELVDGLNRLTEDRHAGLYAKHRGLSSAVRRTLEDILAAVPNAPGCIFLDDLTRDHRSLVGGKALSLGLLRQSGIPVPDGFVVTSAVCAEFLREKGLDSFIEEKLRAVEKSGPSARLSEDDAEAIRARIIRAPLPVELARQVQGALERLSPGATTAVSVRSCALVEDELRHTFAGQFKTVLNVTSPDAVETAIKEVIASNYSVRATAYRVHAGLPLARHDMAVLCQCMVRAKSAGVLFTVNPTAPESGRMLISAVPGLGLPAVGGAAPADIYRPLRDAPAREPMEAWAAVASKTDRLVAEASGGVREEKVPEPQRDVPALSESEVLMLVRYGLAIESLSGAVQDIEWAATPDGRLHILQARDALLARKDQPVRLPARGEVLLEGGVCASPGRRIGRVKIVRSSRDIEEWRKAPYAPSIMVLRQSMVDAAGWLPEFEGVVVDLGNPADHLSCVAREYYRPMLTGTGNATGTLHDGQWIVLDADRTRIERLTEESWPALQDNPHFRPSRERSRPVPAVRHAPAPGPARLRDLIEPLNLTDAYGPTFSILECKSMHDIIRYTHEMAVLAMFNAGDDVLAETDRILHRLDEDIPFHFLIADLGGGLVPGVNGFRIGLGEVLSAPLRALWKGMATPGLRWNRSAPAPGLSGLFSRSLLDSGGSRPVGMQNYALITGDYLNLNARVDYHFAMIDAVCGSNSRGNYLRFRFKGGGTSAVQRERRARFIAEVLQKFDFVTDQRDDLVTASLAGMRRDAIAERLTMLGRLLGFSRLLDSAMSDDSIPHKIATAFLEGDYALERFEPGAAQE